MSPPRSWTLEAPGQTDGGRPVTVNALVNMHRMDWARKTSKARKLWGTAAMAAGIPALDKVVFIATPLHKNRAAAQDPGACAPEVKAAIDGLVDAKVIPDDTAQYVLDVSYRPHEIVVINGLRLTVVEVNEEVLTWLNRPHDWTMPVSA